MPRVSGPKTEYSSDLMGNGPCEDVFPMKRWGFSIASHGVCLLECKQHDMCELLLIFVAAENVTH